LKKKLQNIYNSTGNPECDLRDEDSTPLYFKFMAKIENGQVPAFVKVPYIEVEYYQTKKIIPFGHYKPISKILFWARTDVNED
jgi:hypothetical protein